MKTYDVTIIGAGLAGSEAAWQIANAGFSVKLIEMRPITMTKAHKTGQCAELVCSNSFRGADLTNGVGLLKEELRRAGSFVMQMADETKVPAGGALAVDRELFSAGIDQKIKNHPKITFVSEEVKEIPSTVAGPVVIATGPLTAPTLAKAIQGFCGEEQLAFFDAISPIILGESIDLSKIFRQSRYDKGDGADYLNIPLDKEFYYKFIDEVARAEKFGGHDEVESDMVDNLRPFEGCMPIEEMVKRGPDTLRFGPMKPVGLRDPNTGREPYGVIQLRQDDRAGTLWSMVGFQTKMKHGEQLRVFKMLPGLENAEFVRLGTVHRNSFIQSPKLLTPTYSLRTNSRLFFAGQITGVEGYVESTASGFVVGKNVIQLLRGLPPLVFPPTTAMGALAHYVSDPERKFFQPMNINYGLISGYAEAPVEGKKKNKNKNEKRLATAERALQEIALLTHSQPTAQIP